MRTISPIWRPTVCTGFSAVSGSWKIIAISPPRIRRMPLTRWPVRRSSPSTRFAAGDARRVGRRPSDAHRRHRLAGARLADDREHLAADDVEADTRRRPGLRRRRCRSGPVQVADRQHMLSFGDVTAHFSFGSSASRRPSPTNMKASTVRKIAMPGKNSRCGAFARSPLPSADHQAPRRGRLLRADPRNDSAASARITPPTASVPYTMIGCSAFGRMWREDDARAAKPERAARPRRTPAA